MKNKRYLIKILGLVVSMVGAGATLVNDLLDHYETSALIDEKIEKAFADRENDEDDEEEES